MSHSQRLSCAADLNRIRSLRRKISPEDKYHTVQSFVMCEMNSCMKMNLFGNISRVIRRAISLNLLQRLNHDDRIDAPEDYGEVTEELFRKHSVSYREFFRAAVGFIDCPVSTRLALTDSAAMNGSSLQSSLWTKRTFSIASFAEANDTVKVMMLYMINRKNTFGRKLKMEHIERFLRFASNTLRKLPGDQKKLVRTLLRAMRTRGNDPGCCQLLQVMGALASEWDEDQQESTLKVDE